MSDWHRWNLEGPNPDDSSDSTPSDGSDDEPLPEDESGDSSEESSLTLERLSMALALHGWRPHNDSVSVTVTLEGISLRFHREPETSPWLQVESRVRLESGADGEEPELSDFELQQVANTWNTTHLQPTVFADRSEEGRFFVLATRFFVGEGLTNGQIEVMIRRALVVGLQATRELPGLIPPTGLTSE